MRSPLRRRLLLTAVALLAAGILAWRWLDTLTVATGETRASPDGRFTASVMDVNERHFVTGTARRRFRYRVTGPGLDVDLDGSPLPGPYFGSRSSVSVVRWAPDSSAVRFVFPSAEFRISTGPDAASPAALEPSARP